jgi:hypothetical protein
MPPAACAEVTVAKLTLLVVLAAAPDALLLLELELELELLPQAATVVPDRATAAATAA